MRKFSTLTGQVALLTSNSIGRNISNSFCKLVNYRLMMSNEIDRMMKGMVIAERTVRGCNGREGKITQNNAICTDHIPKTIFLL